MLLLRNCYCYDIAGSVWGIALCITIAWSSTWIVLIGVTVVHVNISVSPRRQRAAELVKAALLFFLLLLSCIYKSLQLPMILNTSEIILIITITKINLHQSR